MKECRQERWQDDIRQTVGPTAGADWARIVHHVKHLRKRPDLALSIWDTDTGERQLISVCKQCHEELHPESQRQYRRFYAPVTVERWD